MLPRWLCTRPVDRQFDQGAKSDNLSRLSRDEHRIRGDNVGDAASRGELLALADRDPARRPGPDHHGGQPLGPCLLGATARKCGGPASVGRCGPSPVAAHGLVYVANEFPATSRRAWAARGTSPRHTWPSRSNRAARYRQSAGHGQVPAAGGVVRTLSCYDAREGGDPFMGKGV